MRLSKMSMLTMSLAILTSAIPTSPKIQMRATCTTSAYPSILNDTSGISFSLQVRADDPAYDGHNIQLRPATPASYAVVDATSPVLYVTLIDGTLFSQARNENNAYYDLGPVGGLRSISSNSTTAEQAFIFRNVTGAGQEFLDTNAGWYLLGGGETATYTLYQTTPDGTVNGFLICENAGYYQLFYDEYTLEPPSYPGCETIGLQTTYAPVVQLTEAEDNVATTADFQIEG